MQITRHVEFSEEVTFPLTLEDVQGAIAQLLIADDSDTPRKDLLALINGVCMVLMSVEDDHLQLLAVESRVKIVQLLAEQTTKMAIAAIGGDHLTVSNTQNGGHLYECAHCGESYEPALPCPTPIMQAIWQAFATEHRLCKPKNDTEN